MADPFRLLVLPGDGIGPEVVAVALRVFETVCSRADIAFWVEQDLLHGAAWEAYGTFCRDQTVARARQSDAVLVGAVGGAEWDDIVADGAGPAKRDGLMRLRPARAYDCLLERTPYRREVVAGAELLVLRELYGGLPYGEPRGIDALDDGGLRAYDANFYTSREIERFARVGFELARRRRGKLASIDKSNVMHSGRLWRRVVGEVGAAYADVELEHLYADNALYQIVLRPTCFDVVIADNILGDLASDLVASLAGSLGMLPSASLPGLGGGAAAIYEPVHGTAPDIAGRGIANPVGAILSVALMFEYSLGRTDLARRVETAVESSLAAGALTANLGGSASTEQAGEAILARLG